MKVKPLKLNIKYPTPTAAERLYAKHQELRKKSGLPDPEEYKKRIAQKQKEIDDLRKEETVQEQLYKKGRFVSGPGKKPFKSFVQAAPVTNEAKDPHEYDYEGEMALNQLNTIMRHAEYLKDMIKPDTNLPEWVQSKITLAADYIQTSCDYLTSEMNEQVKLSEGENKQMKGEDPCWKGYEMVGKKMKKGREVPNCVPVKEDTYEPIESHATLSRKAQIVRDAFKSKKDKQNAKDEASDKFQSEPELSSAIHKT